MQRHAIIILDPVQAHPGHGIVAGKIVRIVRLVLVPEKGACDFGHRCILHENAKLERARSASEDHPSLTPLAPAPAFDTVSHIPPPCGSRTSPGACRSVAGAASARAHRTHGTV